MEEKKYTAAQYARMAGGHALEEDEQYKYDFINELILSEARMFRSKEQISGNGVRMLADNLFVNLLSLYTMSQDYNYAPVAKKYAQKTVLPGNFNRPSPSNTDLYMALHSLKNADKYMSKEKDAMLANKITLRDNQIKVFLNKIRTGNINKGQAQAFFYKLEKDLKIMDPKLRAARRLAQNWETLTTQQRELVGTQLGNFYKMKGRRSEMMPLFTQFTKDNDLMLTPKEKSSIAGTLTKMAVGAAAGYAIGKSYKI